MAKSRPRSRILAEDEYLKLDEYDAVSLISKVGMGAEAIEYL